MNMLHEQELIQLEMVQTYIISSAKDEHLNKPTNIMGRYNQARLSTLFTDKMTNQFCLKDSKNKIRNLHSQHVITSFIDWQLKAGLKHVAVDYMVEVQAAINN